jgi:hypothetical protein
MNASRPVNKQMPAAKAASKEQAANIKTVNHLKMKADSFGRLRKPPLHAMA